jgi:hypothetical protein
VTRRGERFYEAELYRLKGELLLTQENQRTKGKGQKGKGEEAEACLWKSQGKLGEARTVLEDIYSWFTEGFDTRDVQAASILLSELGGSKEKQKVRSKKQKSEQAEGLRPKTERPSSFFPSRLQPSASNLAESLALSPQALFSPIPNPRPLICSAQKASTGRSALRARVVASKMLVACTTLPVCCNNPTGRFMS